MEFTGKITSISDEVQVSDKLRKVSVIVEETTGMYPNSLAVDFLNDKIMDLDHVNEGDVVTISVNSKCREHNGRWYNSINGWKIASKGGAQKSQKPKQESAKPSEPEEWQQSGKDEEDLLPF